MKRRFAPEELANPQLAVQGATWGSGTAHQAAYQPPEGSPAVMLTPLSLSGEEFGSPVDPGHGPTQPKTRRLPDKGLNRALTLILPQSYGPRASDPFFDPFVSAIMGQAAANGFALLLSRRGLYADDVAPYLAHIKRRRTDGFFVVRTSPQDPRIKLLQAQGLPFVVYGRTLDGNDFPYVDIDNEQGMDKVVDHLVQLGHTRIAGIVEPAGLTKSIQRRCGLQAALEARGVLDPRLIVQGRYTRESGYRAARLLLAVRDHRPTAIVCGDDLMAIGACAAASDANLTVGRDVSICGFDDVFGDNIHPGLTTIRNPAHGIGQMLCQMLIQIVFGGIPEPTGVVLDPVLIVRQSTGPVPS